MMTPHIQVMAILERIKRQDAGEIEPPAIAISGKMGANPASEDFVEQSAAASRQQAKEAVGGDENGNAIDLPNEVGSLLWSAQNSASTKSSGQHSACMGLLCVRKGSLHPVRSSMAGSCGKLPLLHQPGTCKDNLRGVRHLSLP